jgi:hypothetical protein
MAHVGQMRRVYNILAGKLEGRDHLGRSRCSSDNVKMDFEKRVKVES